MGFDTIEEVLEAVRQGKPIIVADDKDRENEGDLMIAAEKVTPEIINFMIRDARGLVCMPMEGERLDALNLDLMSPANRNGTETAFTISVDASSKFGVSTGISPMDRAKTVKVLIDPETRPSDLIRPGHVFPLRSLEGGVLRRAGHTEASVDLAKLAGLYPAAVICEIIKDNGSMARLPDLLSFSKKHKLKVTCIADLIRYRMKRERLVSRIAETDLPTRYGRFKAIVYENRLNKDHHIALIKGEVAHKKNVLVRVHSQCLTGDVFGSLRCDCGEQVGKSLTFIEKEGKGVFLYMRQEGRGIGLANKLRAYELQDKGMDTVQANERLGFPADLRDYGIGAQILVDLGLSTIRLLTNNPRKVISLSGYDLSVVDRVPVEIEPNTHNLKYLKTKLEKMGHLITLHSPKTKKDRKESTKSERP